jgi:hypothetical protein
MAKTQHIKFYFWRRKKDKNFRCVVKLKRQCYQRGWENEITTRVGAISNLDVMVSMDSGNAHIAAMLGVKLSHFGVLRILMPVSPFHQPLENTLVSDREQYPMLPPFMEIK